MSLESQKELSRRVLGLWDHRSTDRAEDLVSTDYVNHQMPDVTGGTSAKNLDEWKTLVNGFLQGFPDAEIDILTQVAEGDLVATRWQLNGTHQGDFGGIAASGKRAAWTGVQTDRHAEGKVVESWVDWDKYGFLAALDAVN